MIKVSRPTRKKISQVKYENWKDLNVLHFFIAKRQTIAENMKETCSAINMVDLEANFDSVHSISALKSSSIELRTSLFPACNINNGAISKLNKWVSKLQQNNYTKDELLRKNINNNFAKRLICMEKERNLRMYVSNKIGTI